MTEPIDPVVQAAATLREAGYLVVKIPPCKRTEGGHGKHILITRSAKCPGSEPMPHGIQSSSLGTFGMWVHCRCGDSFSDYTGDEPTDWDKHKQQHGVAS